MINAPAPTDPNAGDYDKLPDVIRHQLSPKEWQWLPDASKASFVQQATEPEHV